ncbi:MAG: hypothetical protein LBQ59_05265 [Candidatus Peribacteria bacterium]|nr:hypothetical protein [Candidatus Peribacteria bacterium]
MIQNLKLYGNKCSIILKDPCDPYPQPSPNLSQKERRGFPLSFSRRR